MEWISEIGLQAAKAMVLKGIFLDPLFDQNEVLHGFGKTQNILTGNRILLLPGNQDSLKSGDRMLYFFACMSGIREIVIREF